MTHYTALQKLAISEREFQEFQSYPADEPWPSTSHPQRLKDIARHL